MSLTKQISDFSAATPMPKAITLDEICEMMRLPAHLLGPADTNFSGLPSLPRSPLMAGIPVEVCSYMEGERAVFMDEVLYVSKQTHLRLKRGDHVEDVLRDAGLLNLDKYDPLDFDFLGELRDVPIYPDAGPDAFNGDNRPG